MRFARPRPKRGTVNLTPLIDVVFQLLVFFMLTANLKPTPPFPVDLPSSQSRTFGDEREGVIMVRDDGMTAFNNQVMNRPDLIIAVRQLLKENPGALVQVKADGEADANAIISMMEDLREAGVSYLVLLTRGAGFQQEGEQ